MLLTNKILIVINLRDSLFLKTDKFHMFVVRYIYFEVILYYGNKSSP